MSRWRPETVTERLTRRTVRDDNGCWLWQGYIHPDTGYGYINLDGTPSLAHRVSYATFVGPIPDGLQLDHLCRVRHCLAPTHLEPVTQSENARRGRAARRATHCKRGHEFTPDNTYLRPTGGRTCRTCKRAGYAKERTA